MKKNSCIRSILSIFLAMTMVLTNAPAVLAAPSASPEDGDPGKGRAEGYVDEGFYDSMAMFARISGYSHNSRFDGYTIKKGVDVSVYQGNINWKKVKADGIDFAFIRLGYRGYGSSGRLCLDTNFETNIRGALDAGLQVGVYYFSQAITRAEAREEANYVLQRIGKYKISLPVVMDFEYASGANGLTGRLYNANLSVSAATDICRAFCATVEAAGYEGMVYANKSMLQNHLNAAKIAKDYKIWLANYTYKTSYAGDYDFWQCSSSESVDGINGNVDYDFWYVAPQKEPETGGTTPSSRVSVTEGLYTISSALNSRLVLDVEGASSANKANVQLYSSNNTDAQKFYLHDVGDKTYILISLASGKVLEVNGGSNDGVNVCQNVYNGSSGQKWWLLQDNNGNYTLMSAASGKVLDVAGANAQSGANVQQYTSNGTNAQKFSLKSCNQKILEEGTYVIQPEVSGGKVLDISGASQADGGNVQIYQMNGTYAQNFRIRYNGDSTYTLYAEHSGKALDISGAGIANGTNVQQYSGNGTAAQKWLLKSVGDGSYVFISVSSGKVLDISGGSNSNGANAQIYEYNGSSAQKMQMLKARASVADGIYTVVSASSGSYVLDVSGASIYNKANIQLYTSNNTDAQKYYIHDVGNKSYILISLASGKVLEVDDGKTYNGANICQNAYNGSDCQKWWFSGDATTGYTLISVATGKALDVQNGSIYNGANIRQYTFTGTKTQKFVLKSVKQKTVEEGIYVLQSALSKSKVLDVSGANRSDYANVQLYQANRTSAQNFQLKYNSDGTYTLLAQHSRKVLDVSGADYRDGANVQQYTSNGTAAQRWLLKDAGNGYYVLISTASGKVLDICGASTANGANAQIYEYNGTNAQKFKLVK